ncbi:restriction endonuclease [Pseudomonas sp. GW456-11-11-14-LB2]|uniref:restriction endonuclease n=1 Tax=Pseudomonas sp. GW456-11-11-14-LB2 TaxID=2070613 RepID=UPI000C88043C|nr:restriction endonuclease [Pseudomonas sp. GW456-11-11-14-LB2]PMW57819.1 restriction endonuclease [Pseudomonas sp. GW456-11-11-14-LB2]
MDIKIEVALPSSASTKEKGDLLEKLTAQLLSAQSYEVINEIRFTAVELDLLCKHKISGKEIYVECKAYRDKPIDANILKNLAGTRALMEYSEAWLVSTAEYGKEAKGFMETWQNKPTAQATTLSFYEPKDVINALIAANVIKEPPQPKALDYCNSQNLLGGWVLLVTPYGNLWAVTILAGGIPNKVIFYYASNNEPVTDSKLIANLLGTDTSLGSLEFEAQTASTVKPILPVAEDVGEVAQVQTGVEWSDYRPARPQDFVGRAKDINFVFDFFKLVLSQSTTTRIFALTGDSGMGKSSLVAKLSDKSRNVQNRNKYFIFPVDVRAATGPSYIYSALLKCLSAAQTQGYGDASIELVVSDVSNPLNSTSLKNYLASVAAQKKLIVLIFDQFEELYSKPELFEVFNRAKSLLLNAASVCSCLCLGFAWKSDSTTQGDHPAYFFWHQLSDYRVTRKLSPFSDSESNAAINIFEKELGQKLQIDLRHNLIVSSQGYPWLLKKLCIHIYEKIQSGADQEKLLANKLDIASLFDTDLNQLSKADRTCLNIVAQRAPVDWFEVIESSSAEALDSLMHRRLVIKSGDRLNVYWDIFREYLLTQKVPVIPLRYLPSTEPASVIKVAKLLQANKPLSTHDLVTISGLTEGSIQNTGTDINMFGVATREGGTYQLNPGLVQGDEVAILQAVREKFKKHAFTLAIQDRTSNSIMTLSDAIAILQEIFPNSTYAEKTWHVYTLRICKWLELCGFLVSSLNGWIYRDQGGVLKDGIKTSRRRRSTKIFSPLASPLVTIECLKWLEANKSIKKADKYPAGYVNALRILARFELAAQDTTSFSLNNGKAAKYASHFDAVLSIASSEPIMLEVDKIIKTTPNIHAKDLGALLTTKYVLNWGEASALRSGREILSWAKWIIQSKKNIKDAMLGLAEAQST